MRKFHMSHALRSAWLFYFRTGKLIKLNKLINKNIHKYFYVGMFF